MSGWRDQAACKGLTDMFFPVERDPAAYLPARSVCATCPVRTECAAAGVDEAFGMWAGTTPPQRINGRRYHPGRRRCDYCGRTFSYRSATARYCSDACRQAASYRRIQRDKKTA